MDNLAIDLVVFPSAGDVGKADLDTNDESARHALQNGVKYSNGNRAIRHMGVPTVSVTMGFMPTSQMPVNLTFAGKHGQDVELFRYAREFEQSKERRRAPPVTPALGSDEINIRDGVQKEGVKPASSLDLTVSTAGRVSENEVQVTGTIRPDSGITLEVTIDGKAVPSQNIKLDGENWSVRTTFNPFEPRTPLYGGVGKVVNNVLITILAKSGKAASGKLVFIEQKAQIQQQ